MPAASAASTALYHPLSAVSVCLPLSAAVVDASLEQYTQTEYSVVQYTDRCPLSAADCSSLLLPLFFSFLSPASVIVDGGGGGGGDVPSGDTCSLPCLLLPSSFGNFQDGGKRIGENIALQIIAPEDSH